MPQLAFLVQLHSTYSYATVIPILNIIRMDIVRNLPVDFSLDKFVEIK